MTEFPLSFIHGGKMHDSKFRQTQGAAVELMTSDRSATVFDFSVFINALTNRKSTKLKTIGKFC